SGESIVLDLAERGVIASSGSACAAGSEEPSHVLTALGIPREVAQTAVRFTLGRGTTTAEVEAAATVVGEILAQRCGRRCELVDRACCTYPVMNGPPMTLDALLTTLDAGETIPADSPLHAVMHETSQEALRITGELNGGYHEPARVRELLAALTGRAVAETVTLFPPFTSDFGKNIRLGERVFL